MRFDIVLNLKEAWGSTSFRLINWTPELRVTPVDVCKTSHGALLSAFAIVGIVGAVICDLR